MATKKKGKKKAAKRKGSKKAAKRKATKRKAAKRKGKRKGKRKSPQPLTAAQVAAICGPRRAGKKKSSKKKGGKKKASKRKGSKRSKRRCAPCMDDATLLVNRRMGRRAKPVSSENIRCAVVRIGKQCRRVCVALEGGKSMIKDGKRDPKVKGWLLSNQPAKGCTTKGNSAVVLRGLGLI